MSIEKNSVVTFHYTVAETGKEPLESSKDGNALTVLVGHGAIIHACSIGNACLIGRSSPYSLYSEKIVTFEDDHGAYDQKDAAGFIRLNGLRLRVNSKVNGVANLSKTVR